MPGGPPSTPQSRVRPELTTWKKVLLGCAVAFVAVGFGLLAVGGDQATPDSDDTPVAGADPTPQGDPSTTPQVPQTALVHDDSPKVGWPADPGSSNSTGDPSTPVQTDSGAAGWSPFFLKGGFSFLVAFCVGFATRVWLKMAALLVGTFCLTLFLLSYLGAIHVDWVTIGGWWDDLAGRIEAEVNGFKTFMTGSLPQAGLAGMGLVAGFKRR